MSVKWIMTKSSLNIRFDKATGYDFCWGYKTYVPQLIQIAILFVIGFHISGNMTSREFRDVRIFYTHTNSSCGCRKTLMVTCLQCISAYARYVYVQLPGRRILVICKVEVFREGDKGITHITYGGNSFDDNFQIPTKFQWSIFHKARL